MKVIETEFQGVRYRSRLEARWAVFMTALGIDFKYEPDGYTQGGICYLPDFYLPQHDYWLEIKPDLPDADAQGKASMLAENTQKPVFILYGDIPSGESWKNDSAHLTCPSSQGGVWSDTCYRWAECGACGFIGMAWEGQSERLACPSDCQGSDEKYADRTEKLLAAYCAARGARFEHGEKPLMNRLEDDFRRRQSKRKSA